MAFFTCLFGVNFAHHYFGYFYLSEFGCFRLTLTSVCEYSFPGVKFLESASGFAAVFLKNKLSDKICHQTNGIIVNENTICIPDDIFCSLMNLLNPQRWFIKKECVEFLRNMRTQHWQKRKKAHGNVLW